MKRLIARAALCVPVAGFAATFDVTYTGPVETFQIRVAQDELANCQAKLRDLRQRPVVTDGGWFLPSFIVDDDLPRSVCVTEA